MGLSFLSHAISLGILVRTSFGSISDDCLIRHNNYRALHQCGANPVGNLTWNNSLAQQAQEWANYLASTLKFEHASSSQRPNQGENLFYSWKSPDTQNASTCPEAVKAWYDEIVDYNWTDPGTSKNNNPIGHFTQVVWADSTELGMAIATNRTGGKKYTYIVARYSPPGNYMGQFGDKVCPLLNSPSSPSNSSGSSGSTSNSTGNVPTTSTTQTSQSDGNMTTFEGTTTTSNSQGNDPTTSVPTTAPSQTTFTATDAPTSVQTQCLTRHNDLRKKHRDTPDLTWSSSLATQAQEWANRLALELKMYHSTNDQRPNQGENLFSGWKIPDTQDPSTSTEATQAWYDEIKDYDWSKPGSSEKGVIGHFTQVVWKSSTQLGCAIAINKTGGKIYTYIVARYSPPGNYIGQYEQNVMPLTDGQVPQPTQEVPQPTQFTGSITVKAITYKGALLDTSDSETRKKLSNLLDPLFIELKGVFEVELKRVFRDAESGVETVKVLKFRFGSLIVDFIVTFKSSYTGNQTSAATTLDSALSNQTISSSQISFQAHSVAITGTPAPWGGNGSEAAEASIFILLFSVLMVFMMIAH